MCHLKTMNKPRLFGRCTILLILLESLCQNLGVPARAHSRFSLDHHDEGPIPCRWCVLLGSVSRPPATHSLQRARSPSELALPLFCDGWLTVSLRCRACFRTPLPLASAACGCCCCRLLSGLVSPPVLALALLDALPSSTLLPAFPTPSRNLMSNDSLLLIGCGKRPRRRRQRQQTAAPSVSSSAPRRSSTSLPRRSGAACSSTLLWTTNVPATTAVWMLILALLTVHAYIDESSGSLRRHQLLHKSLHNHYNRRTSQTQFQSHTNSSVAADENEASTAAEATERAYLAYLHTSFRDQQRLEYEGPATPSSSSDQHNQNRHRSHRGRTDRTASLHAAFPPFPQSKRQANLAHIQSMFQHGWDSYLMYSYPDELTPMSCGKREFDLIKLPGLTMIDALDTLVLLGNYTEFVRSLERVRTLYAHDNIGFAVDQNVSVFETNIRVLGGLLSAHQLALAYLPQHPVPLHNVFDPTTNQIRWGYDSVNNDDATHPVTGGQGDDTTAESGSSTDDDVRIREQGMVASNAETETTTASTTASMRWSNKYSFYQDVVVSALLQDLQNHLPAPSPSSVHPPMVPPHVDDSADALLHLDVCFRYDSRRNQTAAKSSKTSRSTASDSQHSSSDYYRYDGFLLDLARDMGQRLLPAFDTPTGIPYGTVNLLYGVPDGETPIASLAGGGTVSLEFHLLSQLTGDPRFANAAKLATRALFVRQSSLGLYGKHSTSLNPFGHGIITHSRTLTAALSLLHHPPPPFHLFLLCVSPVDVNTGQWTESLSGIGSNSDSFLEYLAKHYFLFLHDPDFWTMLVSAYTAVYHFSREGEWYVDVEMNHGSKRGHARRVFESLMAFYPGLQVLLGEIVPAARSANAYFLVREWLGFLPERFSYPSWKVDAGRGAGKHPLRPELLESAYFLHRATRGLTTAASGHQHHNSSGWLWAQDFALHKLDQVARVKCGYAGVTHLDPDGSGRIYGDGGPAHLMDEMPSFFLSETLKYLYLSFDEGNVLHQDDTREWIFTTEAHPIHYVEPVQARPDAAINASSIPFAKEREALKELLRNRLRRKTHHPKPEGLDRALPTEAWSEKTQYKAYSSKIHGVVKEIKARNVEMPIRSLLMPFVPSSLSPSDFKNDTRQGSNFAHLALTNLGLGPGTAFQKACPNFYSSDLLWIHALNGGAVDYSEIYVSVTRDALEDHPIDFMVLGAAEALGVHGTGVYPGSHRDNGASCPVPDARAEQSKDTEVDGGTDQSSENRQHIATPGNVVQIQSADFGMFEVMPEADGSGFYIHLVRTGETIVVTFFEEFAMTYSSTPVAGAVQSPDGTSQGKGQSPWKRMGSRLTSIFGGSGSGDRNKYEDPPFANVPTTRRVLVSDFHGNTFSCEVEVFESYTEGSTPVGDEADRSLPQSVEEVLATFPCAPARFGVTDIQLLAQSGGVSIQAPAVPPQDGDEVGCRGLTHEAYESHITLSAADADSSIRIVRRGECSFYSKAVNQRLSHNANGVIVLNDHESDIFIMTASEQDEGVLVEPEVVPATVLLTGLDGDEMLDKLAVDRDDEAAQVGVRISITRQPNTLDGRGADFEWPFAVGSAGALTVFAESGWGIQATKRIGRTDWQLQLLKREPVTPSSSSESDAQD